MLTKTTGPNDDPTTDTPDIPDGVDGPDDRSHGSTWTRRGVIAGVAAAGVGAAAGLVAGATPAGADGTQGSAALLGTPNTSTSETTFTSSADISIYGVAGLPSGLVNTATGAVIGDSDVTIGLIGASSSQGDSAIYGTSSHGPGVYAESLTSWDLAAAGTGRVLQAPQGAAGPPTSTEINFSIGESIRDADGVLYLCVASGSPGVWAQVAAGPTGYAQGASCLLSAPIRLLDTRFGATAPTSPGHQLAAGGILSLQVTGEAVDSIVVPASAVAVIGNVTAVNTAGRGYLTLWPDGATQPGASSLNFPATTAVANGVTVALSSAGVANIYTNQATDILFDATGFIA